ncbi:MAG: DUF302 domain-containing protein [Acinetobacter sp.]|nr:MAG: DUF302 domain-containing protein [Acinetobacter sp.]
MPQGFEINRKNFIYQLSAIAGTFLISFKTTEMDFNKNIITRESKFSVEETVNRIAYFLQSKGIRIYARIDQQKEMAKAGKAIAAMEFIMFGKPEVGFKAISSNPLAALDLPLKILVWENPDGNVFLAYNHPAYLTERYHLDPTVASLFALDDLINNSLGI